MTQRWQNRSPFQIVPRILLLALILLLLLPQAGWAFSQPGKPLSVVPLITPGVKVQTQGDIEYAYLNLDGKNLFLVTAKVTPEKPGTDLSPVQRRIQTIESPLQRIVERNFDPQDVYVTVASLDRQTVILAGNQDRDSQEIIMTVTELDAQVAGKPIPALAKEWADTLHQALQQGWEARRPEARRRQIIQAIWTTIAILVAALVLYGMQRAVYSHFKKRRQLLLKALDELPSFDLDDVDAVELTKDYKQMLYLKRRQAINVLLRRLLRLIQALIWSGGIAWILLIFPETRSSGQTVIAFVVKFFIVVLTMLVVAQLCRYWINRRLESWVEEASLETDKIQRIVLRAPTLAGILDEMIRVLSWSLGIILIIDWEQVPIASIWTGAGLLGVALSLVFQNLLRDWLNGFLIIFGDQYAVGDIVNIANTTGLVEGMSLRSTQIRGDGGSLSIIPHGQITTVRNLTKDWSRVDFTVQITKEADATHAMQIMKKVAEDMASDPEWQSDILEPTSLIAVNQISASGTQLLIWIKTKRSKQWEVEREFRHRLKLAFDQEGIQIQ